MIQKDECTLIEPLHDMVVLRFTPENVTDGGIIVPVETQNERFRAVVVAVGPGAHLAGGGMRVPPESLIGQTVLVNSRATLIEITPNKPKPNEKIVLADYVSILAIDHRRAAGVTVQ